MISVLIVSVDCPYPANHGGRLDILERIQLLVKIGVKVDLVVTYKENIEEESKSYLESLCRNVFYVKREGGNRSLISSLWAMKPYQITTRLGLSKLKLVDEYDYVICESEYVSEIINNKTLSAKIKMLRVHNDESSYYYGLFKDELSLSKKIYYFFESLMFRLNDEKIKKIFDKLLYISIDEYNKSLPGYGGKSLWLAPHVPLSKLFNTAKFDNSFVQILFVGNLFMPNNIKGIVWYLNEVHELVLSYNSDIHLTIAGNAKNGISDELTSALAKFPHEKVTLVKTPNDNELNDLYDKHSIFINPMLNGAGVKLKNLDALRNSFYVVSTSVGAEGTGVVNGVDTIIADTPEDFAKGITAFFQDKKKAENIAYNGYCHLKEHFDAEKTLRKIFNGIIHE